MGGYAAIGLNHPKDKHNVGGVLRAAHCYGASMVAVAGQRYKKVPTDTLATYRHIPLLSAEKHILDLCPYDCVPVGVEFLDSGTPLPQFKHPRSAFYIFGAEDQTLGKEILSRCRDVVYVPTNFCMNLAATVNVILYDRMAKGAKT
jgi:tRNA(Leu) C34 or U34 (ribose-2'-O)-methylase TrmL